MHPSEYARMAERESTYWWHLGRLHIIETYLRQATKGKRAVRILNVGCGTGGTIPLLEKYGTVDNVDVSEEAIAFMHKQGYRDIIKVDGIALPFKDETYDIVGAFDVLEHIEDDLGALQEWHRVLKKDGAVVLTVPAYEWLWTEHDVSLMHFRRYTVPRLRGVLKRARFKVDRISHGFVFSLPLIVGFRFLHKLSGRQTTAETSYVNVPAWVNRLFTNLLILESRLHFRLFFIAGTSIIVRSSKYGRAK